MGRFFLGVQDHRHWGKLIFFDVWQMGEVIFFGVLKMGGRDIIRKHTFECRERPAAGTASTLIKSCHRHHQSKSNRVLEDDNAELKVANFKRYAKSRPLLCV